MFSPLLWILSITAGVPLQNSQISAVPPVWHTMYGLAANGLAMYRLAAYGLAGKAWPQGGRCSLRLAEISPEGIPTSRGKKGQDFRLPLAPPPRQEGLGLRQTSKCCRWPKVIFGGQKVPAEKIDVCQAVWPLKGNGKCAFEWSFFFYTSAASLLGLLAKIKV